MTRNKKRILSVILIILVALITLIISGKETLGADYLSYKDSERVDLPDNLATNPYMYCINHGWAFVTR